jgi:hypothetical protein
MNIVKERSTRDLRLQGQTRCTVIRERRGVRDRQEHSGLRHPVLLAFKPEFVLFGLKKKILKNRHEQYVRKGANGRRKTGIEQIDR